MHASHRASSDESGLSCREIKAGGSGGGDDAFPAPDAQKYLSTCPRYLRRAFQRLQALGEREEIWFFPRFPVVMFDLQYHVRLSFFLPWSISGIKKKSANASLMSAQAAVNWHSGKSDSEQSWAVN